ncbi:MAG: hypothetical protein HRT38_03175 [Alteromonadaceae bacterium]|nr:hypothetical protein [Alteromonadaceae bacterium]
MRLFSWFINGRTIPPKQFELSVNKMHFEKTDEHDWNHNDTMWPVAKVQKSTRIKKQNLKAE